MLFKYIYQEDDCQFELLIYFIKSFCGSNIEFEGSGVNFGQRCMVVYLCNYIIYVIEFSYLQLFRMGSSFYEVIVGYCYLNEIMDEKVYCFFWYNFVIVILMFVILQYYQYILGGIEVYVVYIDDVINVFDWIIIFGLCYENICINVDDFFVNI